MCLIPTKPATSGRSFICSPQCEVRALFKSIASHTSASHRRARHQRSTSCRRRRRGARKVVVLVAANAQPGHKTTVSRDVFLFRDCFLSSAHARPMSAMVKIGGKGQTHFRGACKTLRVQRVSGGRASHQKKNSEDHRAQKLRVGK